MQQEIKEVKQFEGIYNKGKYTHISNVNIQHDNCNDIKITKCQNKTDIENKNDDNNKEIWIQELLKDDRFFQSIANTPEILFKIIENETLLSKIINSEKFLENISKNAKFQNIILNSQEFITNILSCSLFYQKLNLTDTKIASLVA